MLSNYVVPTLYDRIELTNYFMSHALRVPRIDAFQSFPAQLVSFERDIQSTREALLIALSLPLFD